MSALLTLTIANLRSFVRDRAAVFWTLAFPLIFIFLFGSIFSGGADLEYRVGWVDEDGTPASSMLREAFGGVDTFVLTDGTRDEALAAMRDGDRDAVIVVPAGFGAQVPLGAAAGGSAAANGTADAGGAAAVPPSEITLYTDPSQQTASGLISQIVGQVVGGINQALSGRPPALSVRALAVQAQQFRYIDYFVPSVLAMSLMQLGLFSAIPLVEQREKLILKRLGATPLRRWALVGSNILVRLAIGIAQTIVIVAVGVTVFGVQIVGNVAAIAAIVVLGALTFTAIGYVVASFAPTEEAANMLTSVIQMPMMFLSGIFFPLEQLPDWLRTVAAAVPLTYLGDALRQVMVDGTPFVPLSVGVAVLAGWLVVSFGVSARFFRWQ